MFCFPNMFLYNWDKYNIFWLVLWIWILQRGEIIIKIRFNKGLHIKNNNLRVVNDTAEWNFKLIENYNKLLTSI